MTFTPGSGWHDKHHTLRQVRQQAPSWEDMMSCRRGTRFPHSSHVNSARRCWLIHHRRSADSRHFSNLVCNQVNIMCS
jgi:hypothetical protein